MTNLEFFPSRLSGCLKSVVPKALHQFPVFNSKESEIYHEIFLEVDQYIIKFWDLLYPVQIGHYI